MASKRIQAKAEALGRKLISAFPLEIDAYADGKSIIVYAAYSERGIKIEDTFYYGDLIPAAQLFSEASGDVAALFRASVLNIPILANQR